MSQDTKNPSFRPARTMIGITAPIHPPRPASPSGPQPAQFAPDPAAFGGTTSPTAQLRPRPASLPPGGPRGPGATGGVVGPGGADPDDLVGHVVCGYRIRRKLAEGGMGMVFEGAHAVLGRTGAIKVLRSEFCRSEEVVERFYQEARAVNAIRHENIVEIYDFGRDALGRVCFVMEYLEGESLAGRIRRGALAWVEAFPILDQTLRALQAAHDKGFVHRDLKPDNIWLRYVDGRVQVKLLDFGIAKLVGVDSSRDKLTQTGSIIGTPHYMSPEQINSSKALDRRSDLYSLGVITYEMFAGVTPFVGDTPTAVLMRHVLDEPPRLADLPAGLGVPAAIADVIDRMLVKDPAARYPSAADVLSDLHDVNGDRRPTHADTLQRTRPHPPSAAPAPAAAPGRPRRAARLVGVAAVAAAVVGGLAVWATHRPEPLAVSPPRLVPAPAVPEHPPGPVEPPRLDYEAVRKDAQTVLRAALRETEPAVRVQGSDALGRIKDQPSTPALGQLTENDPDHEVRGHSADALGAIGAPVAPLLTRLEAAAPPPLQVWYASALARLGDKAAARRLFDHARSKDLAIMLRAGLTLSELGQPGDPKVLAVLRALAAHEAELDRVAPYAGAMILSRMAGLRDAPARKQLHALLDNHDEGVQLAAAEGLARIGDDAGKQVLHAVATDAASPNQLVAAVAQIALGEYGGLDLITARLTAEDPKTQQLAARGLGEIGEYKSLWALIAAANHGDWTVRIAAAAAIVAIVGIDPKLLAQASVDWTRSALDSQDWAVRKAAAGVLADIPETQAMPLLAQAIADPDPGVRLAASRSAGKIKTHGAAVRVMAAVKTETDAKVKEQQVKVLGEIADASAHDTLAQIAEQPGRIGVLAAGSLIAVGDPSGKARLDAAVADKDSELRLAAVEAAATANQPVVIPTLQVGILDRVFAIRFTAAEALAALHDKVSALPVLNEALDSRDADVFGRAVAALTRLGEKLRDKLQRPVDLVDSADPRQRLAAVSIVRALPPAEAVPLLRRLVVDLDPEVRHAGVDAVDTVAASDQGAAIKLYKPLVHDADPVVRSTAAGRLARLVPVPPVLAAAPPAPPPAPAPAAPLPPDPNLPKVQLALDGTAAAAVDARTASDAFDAAAAELAAALAAPARDATAAPHVEALAARLDEAAGKLEAASARVEAAAQAVSDAAGASPSADATKLVTDARALAQVARDAATGARAKTTEAAAKARSYVQVETGDVKLYIAAAEAAIAAGNFVEARHKLDIAAQLLRKAHTKLPGLDEVYGQLYDGMARRAGDPAARRKLLEQAQDAYRRFTAAGTGPLVQRASDRLVEIGDELKELGAP